MIRLGAGTPGVQQAGQFIGELADVQGDPVADDVGDVRVEHARGQGVQGEAAIIIDDGVPRIGAALEADDDVGRLRQQIGDFPLAFVAPVGADDRFYHRNPSYYNKKINCLSCFFRRWGSAPENTTHYNTLYFKMQG